MNSVRLACVRHAASVRPEPGSNSPYNFRVLSSFTYLLALFPFPKKLFELSESALSSTIVFSLSSGLFAYFQLFNFQRAFRRLATAFIYYHTIYILSTPFFNFFKVFQTFEVLFDAVRYGWGDSGHILSSITLFCQHLFSFLSVNLVYSSYFGLTKAFTIFKVWKQYMIYYLLTVAKTIEPALAGS